MSNPTDSFLLRMREKDTPIGISAKTLDTLATLLNKSKTDIIHLALKDYALRHGFIFFNVLYDGDLTDASVEPMEIGQVVAHFGKLSLVSFDVTEEMHSKMGFMGRRLFNDDVFLQSILEKMNKENNPVKSLLNQDCHSSLKFVSSTPLGGL